MLILGGKAGKKGIFGPIVRRLTQAGGGNSSNLTCNGLSNGGAKQLTNLTQTLLKCETEIQADCDPTNLPQPNTTEVNICNKAVSIFSTKIKECVAKNGSAACTCWSSSELTTASTIIKSCDCRYKHLFASLLPDCPSVYKSKIICQGTEELYNYFWNLQKI